MPIPVTCSGCSAKMAAPDAAAGKKIKCPRCQQIIAVPAPAADFEVVEDDPAPKKPAASAPAKPKSKAVVEIDDEEDEDEKPRKKKPAKAAVEDDEDDRPRKKRKAAAEDDEDDEDDRPRKKKKKKRAAEGGTSLARNIVGGVVLLILLGVVGYVYYEKFGKREKEETASNSSSGNNDSKDPPGPRRPSGPQFGPSGPGPNNSDGKADLYAGTGLPAGTVSVEEEGEIVKVCETEAFADLPKWYLSFEKNGPDGQPRFHARVFLHPSQHSKLENLWNGQQIKIRGQRTAPQRVGMLGPELCDFYAAQIISTGPAPKFVEMTVDQLLKEFHDAPEAAKAKWGLGADGSYPWIRLTGTFDGDSPPETSFSGIQLKGTNANAGKPNRVLIDVPLPQQSLVKGFKAGQSVTVRVRGLNEDPTGQVRFITGLFPPPK